MTIVYLKPTATGTGAGTDWDNASTVASFAALYTAAVPGDEIWFSSVGVHLKSATTTLTNANNPTAALPIRVRGMRPMGTAGGFPEKAVIKGVRTSPWPQVNPGGTTVGGTLFDLSTGAKFTHFENLIGMNHDIFIRFNSADNDGCWIIDCEALNVRAGFSTGFEVVGSRIRRFAVIGYTLYGITFAGNSNDTVIEDCEVTPLIQDDNDTTKAPTGIFFDVTAHNARVRRCRAYGGFDYRTTGYWQGQGFGTEEDCDDIVFEDCYASGWADAGWDVKASNLILRRCVAEDNMRNFRFHRPEVESTAQAIDCISRFPVYRGGSGSVAHIQLDGTLFNPTLVEWFSTVGRSRFESDDPNVAVVQQNGTNNAITITHAFIRQHPDAVLQTGATATFVDCITEDEG